MNDNRPPDATEADGEAAPAPDAQGGEDLAAQLAAAKEQILRYAAEADNTRRRSEREVNDARAYAIQKFARDLLGVADNLARALEHAPADASDPLVRGLAVGLEMTQKELMGAFERNGLKPLKPAPGERFDPHQHQAMMENAMSDLPPGSVTELLQTGYELFGRVIRPALVVVSGRAGSAKVGDEQDRAQTGAEERGASA